jgi:hypothetical protein
MDDASQAREPRGVHNPRVVDLVSLDGERDAVVLLMLEERPWGSAPEQLRQLEEKFNRYLGYVQGGFLAQQYPQYQGKAVRFRLDCATPPGDAERRMLEAMKRFAAGQEIGFEVNVIQRQAGSGSSAS